MEQMTEQQAREAILASVKEYYEMYGATRRLIRKGSGFRMPPESMTVKR